MNNSKRVFIKLSGEMLSGEGKKGYNHSIVSEYFEEIIEAAKKGEQIAIGVGGGNILRGRDIAEQVGRVYADYMG
ncbi:MAG: UMP kinase, partial [Nitrospinae bacterium]|nr:UMP kinase [Nitrospinota bacterium]